MKVKIKTVLTQLDGKTPLSNPDREGSALILQDACMQVLCAHVAVDDDKAKWSKYELYKKIRDAKGNELDLLSEEIVLLKTMFGKVSPPLIMGQAWELLENKKSE